MLKTTYRAAQAPTAAGALPTGWTEHRAPTGHTYYYNAQTKQSTYTRPAAVPETEDLQIDYNATAPDQVVQASMKVLDEFHKNNPETWRGQGHFTGGRAYQDRNRRGKDQDRPKSKAPIPNSEPWLLVKTKFGRRFVHNTVTKESFWKFPQDVMMAVIEMDRLEWEAKKRGEDPQLQEQQKLDTDVAADKEPASTQVEVAPDAGFDSDEYEEVEVTDDEDEDGDHSSSKRMRIEQDIEPAAPKPVDFDEDDIAWQLAQMEQEEDDYGDEGYDNTGEDEEGLPLTAEDSQALFRSLLDDTNTDPYSTFDALIEYNNASIIHDPRWVALPNMSSRRAAFTTWSRDRIAELKAQEALTSATTKKKDPRVEYLNFLMDNATPKLYWPEFKRKFKKEPEMKDLQFSDKEREKLYREYVAKLKGGEADRKKEFRDVLKGVPQGELWNRRTSVDDLPDMLLRDLRFYLVRDRRSRDELVKAHLDTLGA